jgi:hypothetical protein
MSPTYFERKGNQMLLLGIVCSFIGILALYAIVISAFEVGEGL